MSASVVGSRHKSRRCTDLQSVVTCLADRKLWPDKYAHSSTIVLSCAMHWPSMVCISASMPVKLWRISGLMVVLCCRTCYPYMIVQYFALHHDGASSNAYWAALWHHDVVQCGTERERGRHFPTVPCQGIWRPGPQNLWLHLEPLACCLHKRSNIDSIPCNTSIL